ncbi:glycoside hydrolase [Ramicandelaber brevisporus]|nr:glycoside hydrolase [Ramicandelaber brevisporus]
MVRVFGSPLAAVLAALAVAAVTTANASCTSQIYCNGAPILDRIQRARIFPDSKTFVDRPTLVPEAQLLDAFNKLPANASADEFKAFVDKYFGPAGVEITPANLTDFKANPKVLDAIADPIIKGFATKVHGYWKELVRVNNDTAVQCAAADGAKCESSLIKLPNPFVVPGGRFREIYYWDSFFTMEGLLASELYDTCKSIILNFAYLVKTYGFIPNGARVYYLNRSQPPLFIQMAGLYYDKTKDLATIQEVLPQLRAEYSYWINNHTIEINSTASASASASASTGNADSAKAAAKAFKLSRYFVNNDTPRPESYFEDANTAENATAPNFNLTSAQQKELYADLATAAESGWDFSTRWARNYDPSVEQFNLQTIRTRSVVPVELNSILYNNEVELARLHHILRAFAREYKQAAKVRRQSILSVMRNHNVGSNATLPFNDYDLENKRPLTNFTVSAFWPFWGKLTHGGVGAGGGLNTTELVQAWQPLVDLLPKYPGGMPATLFKSGLQWDYPNSWPPLTYMLVRGLDTTYSDTAKELAQRYVSTVFCGWYATGGSIDNFLPKIANVTDDGHIFEKQSATAIGQAGGGGEYTVQTGFGWSNGVLLWLLEKYGKDIVHPNNCAGTPAIP